MMHTNLDGMWSNPNTEMAHWTAARRTWVSAWEEGRETEREKIICSRNNLVSVIPSRYSPAIVLQLSVHFDLAHPCMQPPWDSDTPALPNSHPLQVSYKKSSKNSRQWITITIALKFTFLSTSNILVRFFVSFWKSWGARLHELILYVCNAWMKKCMLVLDSLSQTTNASVGQYTELFILQKIKAEFTTII